MEPSGRWSATTEDLVVELEGQLAFEHVEGLVDVVAVHEEDPAEELARIVLDHRAGPLPSRARTLARRLIREPR